MARDPREVRSAWTASQRHTYLEPSGALAPYVERYWHATWEYETPYRQLIVPYPNVHLTFRDGRATVYGVASRYQVRVLAGAGEVLGVAFRPGCFRQFLGAPVSTITDRSLDAATIFGRDLPEAPDVAAVEAFLLAQQPAPDPRAAEAADAVALIAAGAQITRVDALVRALGTTTRGLQRLFAEHVGVGPKWVIRRYRLHEVTERLARGAEIDWAALASELGYADQAHFVRDFGQMFGEPPTVYAERY